MFPELIRKKQQLSPEECFRILKNQRRGVLSLISPNGYPYALPLNYFFDEEEGLFYFHCGRVGHKLDAIRHCRNASFCVVDEGEKSTDWSYYFKSVITFGQIEILDDPKKTEEISRRLSLLFTQEESYIENEIRVFLKATILLCLHPEHMTGKRVHEA